MYLSITQKAYLKALSEKIIMSRMQSNFGKRLENFCLENGLSSQVFGGMAITEKGREVARFIKEF